MPKAEITESEAFPVYDIFPIDDHYALPENFKYINWSDVPQEIIDEHKAAGERWRNSQDAIRKLLEVS